MTATRSSSVLGLSLLLLVLQSAPAAAAAPSAEEVAAADALFEQARELVQAARYAEACPKFEESQRLDPASGTLINLAECYEKQGRVASAWGRYLEAAASAQASGNTERERVARARAEALLPQLPKLAITVVPADAPGLEIVRDGVVVGRPQWGIDVPVDPGEHVIEARAPGYRSFHTAVTASSGTPAINVTVPALVLAAPSAKPGADATAPPSSSSGLGTQRIAAIVAGAVGVVGIGVGTGFGLKSKAKHDESYEICPADPCTDVAGREAMEAARSAGTISTVSFIVGGVGLAGGAVLWFTAKDAPNVAVGLGKVELRGRF